MRNLLGISGMVATALALAGCGGGGAPGGPAGDGGTISFTGYYSGKGTANTTTSPITASLGVGSDGTLCGTLIQVRTKAKSTIGGLVGGEGDITEGTIQCYKRDGTPGDLGTLSGQFTATSPGYNVTLTATIKGKTVTFKFINLNVTATPSVRVKRKAKVAGK